MPEKHEMPRTWSSTKSRGGNRAAVARLRPLFQPRKRRGGLPLLCALVLTVFAGTLVACTASEPVPTPTPDVATPQGYTLTATLSLLDLEPYAPPEDMEPNAVSADAMGEVLVDETLDGGPQIVCYWEPGSQYTKYWALRRGNTLLRFCAEDSAYGGGYGVEAFTGLFGRDGFRIEAPRGAAYQAYDYYYLDERGIPKLLAGCAGPVVDRSDLNGDGEIELLWFYHGCEGYYCFQREGGVYLASLLPMLSNALPEWTDVTLTPGGLSFEEDGAWLSFFHRVPGDDVPRSAALRFTPESVEVWSAPEGASVDWLVEQDTSRAGLLQSGEALQVAAASGRGTPVVVETVHGSAKLRTFEDILGADGFAVDLHSVTGDSTAYYTWSGDRLAGSWGIGDDRGDYPVDLDGDGIRELVCNVTYQADGVDRVVVYRVFGDQVLAASADALPEDFNWPAHGPTYDRYDPETNTVMTTCRYPEDRPLVYRRPLTLKGLEFLENYF